MSIRFEFLIAVLLIRGVLPTAFAAGPATTNVAAPAPAIDLDQSPRVVTYHLRRFSNSELAALSRDPADLRCRPIYQTLMTRAGLETRYRREAATALAGMNGSEPALAILDGIGAVDPLDRTAQQELISLFMSQDRVALIAIKDKLASAATRSPSGAVKQAAFAAIVVADGSPDAVWERAAGSDEGFKYLLGGIRWIPDPAIRDAFYSKVEVLVTHASDDVTRMAAIEAIISIPGHDADEFQILATLIKSSIGDVRNAAIHAIGNVPRSGWARDRAENLARHLIELGRETSASQRATPRAIEAAELAEDLSRVLPDSRGGPLRKMLREVAVRAIVLHTVRGQVEFDVNYFTVQAGQDVRIVLENGDDMPHNLVVGQPGSLQEIGIAANAMPQAESGDEKAYVPNLN